MVERAVPAFATAALCRVLNMPREEADRLITAGMEEARDTSNRFYSRAYVLPGVF